MIDQLRSEERTDKAERRSACRRNIVSPDVSRYEAATSGGEALQRSTRSPGGGAWRRSAGKRPIYWLITSPKGTLQALIYLHRYNRDTVNRFLNDYLRPYQQKLEAKRVSAEHVLTGGGSSQSEKTKNAKGKNL